MKIVIGTVIVGVLGWIAWPYYALYDFATSLEHGDRLGLEHRIAWDDVRRGLRDDFNAYFLQSVSESDGAGSALAGLALMVAPRSSTAPSITM
jgi:Protein of unknown function (DUF2939)